MKAIYRRKHAHVCHVILLRLLSFQISLRLLATVKMKRNSECADGAIPVQVCSVEHE